ncbi:hypothetical protein C8R43DRAFT_1112450 [Mycena crocata]|nr:hypothetical protein C8R43DRAFT_1112450 [Mycena crocata]
MPSSSRQREMSSLDAEIEWHYAQIALLKAKRNSLAPISSLPNELLCQIFIIHAVETDTLFNLKWTQIMHVCHRWHDLAMATQPLWAFIQMGYRPDTISRFFKQLDLSGAAPITLKFEAFEAYYTGSILANSGRIQGLEAHGEAKEVYELIHSLPEADFPILSFLDFDPTYKLPKLQELTLDSVALPWRSLRGLTSLRLTSCGDSTSLPHTFDVVLAALGACPHLRTLTLEKCLPPPLTEQAYPTLDLSGLTWISLRDNATTCAVTLNHLRFPSTTSVHVFPYGVRTGPDVSEVLIPIRKHLRAPAAPAPRLVLIEGSVSPGSSHYMTSLFHETTQPNHINTSKASCPFLINSHPLNEAELRRIMTKIFKAIPFESITHLDAQVTTMSSASWKTALKLLPALEAVYMVQMEDMTASFCGALEQIEQLDPAHQTFPRIRRFVLRVFSRNRMRAMYGDEEPGEPEDFLALVLTPLQIYLRPAFDNGNALEVLELDDRDRVLMKRERELDEIFSLVGDRMVWNKMVYDPVKRKADRAAWEVARREFAMKHGIEFDSGIIVEDNRPWKCRSDEWGGSRKQIFSVHGYSLRSSAVVLQFGEIMAGLAHNPCLGVFEVFDSGEKFKKQLCKRTTYELLYVLYVLV